MIWPFAPLPMFGFDCLVVDPPWDFESYSAKGEAKGPRAQYDTMRADEILRLPVGNLVGSHSWCFLWITAPLLPFGVSCLNRWGFRYVSTLAWEKLTKNGKPAMGTGYIVRSMHENVLIGAVGKPLYNHALPSIFPGVRREHSQKPDEFYFLIDEFLPAHARRADIFARQSRPGWATWGREATKFDKGDAA